MNINRVNPQDLSLVTYNSSDLKPLKPNHPHIYMGIGLWSLKDGLSEGLPVDVMHMLLAAKLLQTINPERSPKVVILLADSMALREGADRGKVEQVSQIYQRSLEPLLRLLQLESEIVLSSELEQCPQYNETLKRVDQSPLLQRMAVEDRVHHAYVRTQTAITAYMHQHRGVGVKVGWVHSHSIKPKSSCIPESWDELKFDRLCASACPEIKIQCLYAKAGLKHLVKVNLKEGCPYTAFSTDRRYIVQLTQPKPLKEICLLRRKEARQWKGVAELCSRLMEAGLASQKLLPRGCIRKTHAVATVYNMLNHWSQSGAKGETI